MIADHMRDGMENREPLIHSTVLLLLRPINIGHGFAGMMNKKLPHAGTRLH